MPSTIVVAFGSFIGLWVSMAVLCSPVLAASNCRALFEAGPFKDVTVNYIVAVGGFTLVHVALVFSGTLVNAVVRVRTGWWALLTTLFVVVVGWLTVSVGFPQYNWWNPTEAGIDGRFIFALTGIWYTMWTFILAAFFAFTWFLANYPG